jgi:hypothetical protein
MSYDLNGRMKNEVCTATSQPLRIQAFEHFQINQLPVFFQRVEIALRACVRLRVNKLADVVFAHDDQTDTGQLKKDSPRGRDGRNMA